jgi:hypothetical protein
VRTVSAELESLLLTAPVVLLVEDVLTKEYLIRIWQPDDKYFNFLVAYGRESVRAVTHDLRTAGFQNVFGLVDRDFGVSNCDTWTKVLCGEAVFILPAFEIENYLLDCNALSHVSGDFSLKRSADEISERALRFAKQLLWWFSCCRIISTIRGTLVADFPSFPGLNITSRKAVLDYIEKQDWFREIKSRVGNLVDKERIRELINASFEMTEGYLESGAWKVEFSGKEIFRMLRGYLVNKRYASPEEMDLDLAKRIGDYHHEHSCAPKELLKLKQLILDEVRS